MNTARTFGLIGGGNMAEALIRGLLAGGQARKDNVYVFDPLADRCRYLAETYGIQIAASNADVVRSASTLLLAVKPQFMDAVMAEIGGLVAPDQLVISIAAGLTLDYLEGALQQNPPVIRAMPNTPALVLAGATAISPGRNATTEHMKFGRSVFDAVGVTVVVPEKLMDIVTGLSGSGPAYVFVLLEAMADAAVRLGMPRAEARLLAGQTILGSARLAMETGKHPGELKDMVTSPGGTTMAGLHVLEKAGFRGLIMETVGAAAARSRELGGK